ncbi:hypothetical protein A6A06_25395 [Streptomyces sp. CB02923]|uniref:hypothetical protein n=1 Tax=Streptomyces sp. CB02923 TaxID=1718985 RepID=UPI00094002BA|nr:hypothetical protein [Streptomyces sp. CB02923]OKH98942.1 hypothetical protein A6A06_25395 [Streptomyces sp. CB02923]
MSTPSEEETPRKKRRLFAVPLLVAALAAGGTVLVLQTSSSAAPAASSSQSVARAAQASSSTSASSGTGKAAGDSATRERQAEAFTQCMKDNGVKDFPGITIKENGQLQLKSGGNINPVSKAYRSAAKACASKLPADSSLPKEPSAVTPETPALGFTCTEDCPTAPKAPSLPSEF